jgi:hypothetical protein
MHGTTSTCKGMCTLDKASPGESIREMACAIAHTCCGEQSYDHPREHEVQSLSLPRGISARGDRLWKLYRLRLILSSLRNTHPVTSPMISASSLPQPTQTNPYRHCQGQPCCIAQLAASVAEPGIDCNAGTESHTAATYRRLLLSTRQPLQAVCYR